MKRLLTILFLIFSVLGIGEDSPYAVESKVKEHLDDLLSRIVDREQFLVQVSADVTTRTRRKVIEGETVVESPSRQASPKPPDPMPGFVPDVTSDQPQIEPAKNTRESFENVEISQLKKIQVAVSFDLDLPEEIVSHGKRVARDYLYTRYPQKTQLNFYLIPMLKPKMRQLAAEKEAKPEPIIAEPEEDPFFKWLPWVLFLGVLGALLWKTKTPKFAKSPSEGTQPTQSQLLYPMAQFPNQNPGEQNKSKSEMSDEELAQLHRKDLLATVLANATAFRLYYQNLNPDEQGELEAILSGPAFDNLMASLVQDRAVAAANMDDADDAIRKHTSQFEEYVRSKQWQDQQLFGFLHQLSNEQVISLANFESDLNVCLILRFLKPEQSAFVLDNIDPQRRVQVLQKMNEIYGMPLSDIAKAEQQIRGIVQRLPTTMMGPGKQEVDFWGGVLSQSSQTPEILEELEQTQSKIVHQLQKFKLTLEDAATLPDDFLTQVLSETDNEELCLALTTCSDEVIQVILDNVSERRREVLMDQLPSYQNANKESAQKARNNLTRKIREAAA